MRGILRSLKIFAVLSAALACAALLVLTDRSPAFEGGSGYELYCGTSSAEIRRTDAPVSEKLTRRTAGESVRYGGDCYEALKARYRAELLFTEEADGVQNYYLYSPLLGESVLLNGYPVNLHIAVGREQTAAGTPLIFGGF